jgi:hypothetical protein
MIRIILVSDYQMNEVQPASEEARVVAHHGLPFVKK